MDNWLHVSLNDELLCHSSLWHYVWKQHGHCLCVYITILKCGFFDILHVKGRKIWEWAWHSTCLRMSVTFHMSENERDIPHVWEWVRAGTMLIACQSSLEVNYNYAWCLTTTIISVECMEEIKGMTGLQNCWL